MRVILLECEDVRAACEELRIHLPQLNITPQTQTPAVLEVTYKLKSKRDAHAKEDATVIQHREAEAAATEAEAAGFKKAMRILVAYVLLGYIAMVHMFEEPDWTFVDALYFSIGENTNCATSTSLCNPAAFPSHRHNCGIR